MTLTEIAQEIQKSRRVGPVKITHEGLNGFFYPDNNRALKFCNGVGETSKYGYVLTLEQLTRDDWEMIYS